MYSAPVPLTRLTYLPSTRNKRTCASRHPQRPMQSMLRRLSVATLPEALPIAQHTRARVLHAASPHPRPSRPHSLVQNWTSSVHIREAIMSWQPTIGESQRCQPSSAARRATCRNIRPSVVQDNAPARGRRADYAVAAAAAEQPQRLGDTIKRLTRQRVASTSASLRREIRVVGFTR